MAKFSHILSYGCNWHLPPWARHWNHGLFGEFHVLQQMPGWLKSKGEHCKLEPSLPTKTIQEAALLFPSQLLGVDTAVRHKGQFPLCSTLPVPCQCPAAEASLGAFPNSFKLALPGVFLFLEHGMGSGFQELVEPVMFYVQGCGQGALPLAEFVFLSLYPPRLKGAYAVEKILSVLTQLFSRTQENHRRCKVPATTS